MTVTKDQAESLTALALACRPHGARHWDGPGILAAIGKVKHLALADVAAAVIRAAADRTVETPGVIANPKSPCWRERIADPSTKPTFRPPMKAEECRTHAGQWADSCSACAADRLAGDTTRPADPRRPDGSEHLALARAQLAVAKANGCGHGIDRSRGVCRDCERAEDREQTEVEIADQEDQ